MSNPLISIAIAVYNVEQYLPRCIESVVNQNYKNIEIILVNDGSPDNSPQICDEYAKKDSRIKVIHKQNGGVADVRNTGIANAQGEYIALIDGDDWLDPKFIESLYEGIKTGVDVSECATRLVDNEGNTLSTRGSQEGKISKNAALQKLVTENGIYTTVCNRLYKKSLIENIPFPVGKYHEDDFWVWQVLKKADELYYCEKPLYNYLQRSDGFTGSVYSIRRLDSVQARYECMIGLSDVTEVGDLAKIAFVNVLIYNLQSSLKYLKKADRDIAVKKLMDYKRQVELKPEQYSLIKGKQKLWIRLFMLMPKTTVRVRNIIGIGY